MNDQNSKKCITVAELSQQTSGRIQHLKMRTFTSNITEKDDEMDGKNS